jgi:two-component system alkaline phosphatase synthesis response regulator PhoP
MSHTILIVDDDMDVHRILEEDLKDEGYTVLKGYDGQMALNLAKSHRPSLLIMDVHMPMTNGLKALEYLRKLPETRHIPILFLSAGRSDTIYPAIANHQRVAFIKKPMDLDQVNSMVHQLLEKYQPVA